jgi:hypothetical protein
LFSFEATILRFPNYSSRHSLYPRPKAWDAAVVGAKISLYISIRTFSIKVLRGRICVVGDDYTSYDILHALFPITDSADLQSVPIITSL